MSDILEKLQATTHLSDNEKSIAIYMVEHLEEIPQISSREFARRCYTTATSIHRFIKKLGYKNYNDFKYNIVTSLKNLQVENYSIVSNEDILSLIHKISQLEVESIEQTKEKLSINQFQNIIQLLTKTKCIDIIANDTNARIAQYASHCLAIVGKIVNVYHEVDLQLQLALNVPQDHIVIIISKHALNKRLLKTTALLNKRHITTIAITSKDNQLSKQCRYTLFAPFIESDIRMNEIEFFTSTKYLFDLMFGILLSKDYEKSMKLAKIYNDIFFENQ